MNGYNYFPAVVSFKSGSRSLNLCDEISVQVSRIDTDFRLRLRKIHSIKVKSLHAIC